MFKYALLLALTFVSLQSLGQYRCGDVILDCRVYREYINGEWQNVQREDYENWTMYYEPDLTLFAAWDTVAAQWNKVAFDSLAYGGGYTRYYYAYDGSAWQPVSKRVFENYYTPDSIVLLSWNGTGWDSIEKNVYTYNYEEITSRKRFLYDGSGWVPDVKWERSFVGWLQLDVELKQRWDAALGQWLDDEKIQCDHTTTPYGTTAIRSVWNDTLGSWQPAQRFVYTGDYKLPEREVRANWNPIDLAWEPTDSIVNENICSMGNNARVASMHYTRYEAHWLPWKSDSACFRTFGSVAGLDADRVFTLSPNPASEEAVLTILDPSVRSVRLVDALGRTMLESIPSRSGPVRLNTSVLPSSVYNVVVANGVGVARRSLVVTR